MIAPPLRQPYWPADPREPILESTVGGGPAEDTARAPDGPALVAGTPDPASRRLWTYGQVFMEAEHVTRALLGRFPPGERVAVWAPNSPEWIILEFAAALTG